MPLKVNVGLTKKVGESNYGSRGASVHIEMELDGSLASEPTKLQERIRQLFGLVRSSVDEELNGANGHSNTSGDGAANGAKPPQNGNGSSQAARKATQSQVKAIFAITRSQNVDMSWLLRDRYRVDRAEDLSIKDASALIEHLKKSNGNGG